MDNHQEPACSWPHLVRAEMSRSGWVMSHMLSMGLGRAGWHLEAVLRKPQRAASGVGPADPHPSPCLRLLRRSCLEPGPPAGPLWYVRSQATAVAMQDTIQNSLLQAMRPHFMVSVLGLFDKSGVGTAGRL